ncbi:MAG: hypothetical protein FWC46_01455, partial [Actinomycetia bacterium]|nr:hypothetical protein [Actinomycetes bacterium]
MRLRLSQAPVHRAHRRAVLVVLVLLLVAAGAMVAWRSCVRAAPGTSVAGMDVSGLTASQIAARVTSLQDAFRVEIRVGDRSVQARARDLGVTVDAAATGRAAARTGSWFGALTRHGGGLEAIPLVVRSNATVMRSWLDTAFAAEVAASVSPRVDFDPAAGKYVVTPGSAGSGVDAAGLIARLPELIAARDAAAIELPLVRSVPAITDDEARRIAAQLDGLVATPLSVVSPYDQTVLARPVPADIAAWISATPAAGGATFDIDVSAARIDDFVAQKVAPALAVAPVDEQDLTGSGGASLGVLVPGTPGRALANADEIAQAWFDALVSHQA